MDNADDVEKAFQLSLRCVFDAAGATLDDTGPERDFYNESDGEIFAPPRANYGAIRQALLKLTPEDYMCRLFCRGDRCKYCNPNFMAPSEQAIPGLYSTWIMDRILATSRPTATTIKKYSLFENFKKAGIKSVINLQKSMEHAQCGPPLEKCGFSYDPEDFMKNGIFHYNFGWPDFGAASMHALIDMVKVLQFAVFQGKVAVHCHAGLGRTGVLICAYFMWTYGYSDSQALYLLRSKRPFSVQTKDQVVAVAKFHLLLEDLRPVFRKDVDLREYLLKQKQLLYGYERSLLRHVPEIVVVLCERIHQLLLGYGIAENIITAAPKAFLETEAIGISSILQPESGLAQKSYFPPVYQSLSVENPSCVDENSTSTCGNCYSGYINQPRMYLRSIAEGTVPSSADLNNSPDSKNIVKQQYLNFIDLVNFNNASLNKKCEQYKTKLNSRNFARRWNVLGDETDPKLLLLLVYDWFHNLKEPVVHQLIANNRNRQLKLTAINKFVVRYMANFMRSLSSPNVDNMKRAAEFLSDMLCWKKGDSYLNEMMLQLISDDAR